MQTTTYHNTNGLRGEALKQAVANATKQEDQIFLIYFHSRQRFSASDIHKLLEKAGCKHPLTSTRRAISNLLTKKELIKCSDMKDGLYAKPEHFYQLNFHKYPTKPAEQLNLIN